MKKMIFGLSALIVLFSSCGSDDGGNSTETGDGVLLKKTIENGPDGQFISEASYNGHKIVKITTNDGGRIDFTYTGDDITKMAWKLDNELIEEQLYTYDASGKLATHTLLDYEIGWGSKEVYTYNSDNTATVQNYSGDLVSQTLEGDTYTITFANGEVSQIVTPFETITYTYDNKNNPFKNVTGYGKISYIDGGASGIMHNVTEESSSEGGGSTYTFTYNNNDFPATAVENWDGDVYNTQFFYN
ncbi:hypothetical protein HUK80_13010 [Flavobacterium sp. MAH-1]|uniref:YD repeat-containing protein n=1 Tax=Flavobacterium agri TaxID=2743471 RepID=A0A7Y8Y3B4_9FLAO|nr:hypothetical protein [Flavobacterium agri]NUY81820.1 hypothetical protein [Flavobacterium agri]NYA71844.1 hypothetical protein [Flavobacterium agri]